MHGPHFSFIFTPSQKCISHLSITYGISFLSQYPLNILVLSHWSRYLDQKTAKWPFRSSSQAATCYYLSNHSKVEAIPLTALPKDTTSEFVGLFSTLFFNGEHQAGKLWQLFKPFGPTRRRNRTPVRCVSTCLPFFKFCQKLFQSTQSRSILYRSL